jgi:hypothetical protein
MKKKTKRLILHRETVRLLDGASLHRVAGQNGWDDSDWTICDLCPETTPSKCIICCEPTGSCEH